MEVRILPASIANIKQAKRLSLPRWAMMYFPRQFGMAVSPIFRREDGRGVFYTVDFSGASNRPLKQEHECNELR